MKIKQGVMCDFCHDLITDKDEKQGNTIHYGEVDYHGDCFVQIIRRNRERKAS